MQHTNTIDVGQSVTTTSPWHLSAKADLLAFCFSWLWILIPLSFFNHSRSDYILMFVLVITLDTVHRMLTLPSVYSDKPLLKRFPLRFFLLPVVLITLASTAPYLVAQFVQFHFGSLTFIVINAILLVQLMHFDNGSSPNDYKQQLPAVILYVLFTGLLFVSISNYKHIYLLLNSSALVFSFLLLRLQTRVHNNQPTTYFHYWIAPALIAMALIIELGVSHFQISALYYLNLSMTQMVSGFFIIYVVWSYWHFMMQKYGILRLYSVKSTVKDKVPGYVDKLFIFAWLPPIAFWLAPKYESELVREFGTDILILTNIFESIQCISVPLSLTLLAFALANWAIWEWRINRFINKPRIYFALSTALLGFSFFVGDTLLTNNDVIHLDPIKAYMAVSFAHAIEYIVFIWGFEKKKHALPSEREAPISKLFNRYGLIFYLLIALVTALACWFLSFRFYIDTESQHPYFMGYATSLWVFYLSLALGVMHFYYDGFLWKMRSSRVQKVILND